MKETGRGQRAEGGARGGVGGGAWGGGGVSAGGKPGRGLSVKARAFHPVDAGLSLRLVNRGDRVRARWRSGTEAPGASCVTTGGTPGRQTSSAGSSTVATRGQCRAGRILVRALGMSSWALCTALDMSPTCPAVPTAGATTMHVDTGKAPELCAQVVRMSPGTVTCATLGMGIQLSLASWHKHAMLRVDLLCSSHVLLMLEGRYFCPFSQIKK